MSIQTHTSSSGHAIAYQQHQGEGMGVVFCGGFRSDMSGTKAEALHSWCAERNIPYTRFDYFAHGKTSGNWVEFTIGKALEDALEILDHIATGDQILVGSSMGGWVALLAALERKHQVKGIVGIAAAPDFTERIYYKEMTPEQRDEMQREGHIWRHSEYFNNDYELTLKLIEDGNKRLLLHDRIPIEIPLHLLHGQADDTVPWETALALASKLNSHEVLTTFVKDADHRLHRPEDLQLLYAAIERMRRA